MTASSDSQRLASSSLEEARLFEMLEQPEHWPEDPALQAELAGLLELHLALGTHGPALSEALVPKPRVRWTTSWSLAAAAVLLVALVPAAYTVKRIQTLRTQAQDTVRLEHLARKRTQDRAWIAFFQQSTTLLQDFEQNPALCKKGEEDRRQERDMALVLLEASHQLAAQGAPSKEAELIRASLHAWLSEVAFEDSCLSPERARELRQWAAAHNLESEAGRMERHLRGDGA
jgi:predicted transcriptional regulator